LAATSLIKAISFPPEEMMSPAFISANATSILSLGCIFKVSFRINKCVKPECLWLIARQLCARYLADYCFVTQVAIIPAESFGNKQGAQNGK